jgi:hypothetical protein
VLLPVLPEDHALRERLLDLDASTGAPEVQDSAHALQLRRTCGRSGPTPPASRVPELLTRLRTSPSLGGLSVFLTVSQRFAWLMRWLAQSALIWVQGIFQAFEV